MGPQLYRCGNQSVTASPRSSLSCFNGAATLSLRKPISICGSTDPLTTLQWGRNFIVAETCFSPLNRTECHWLQWGRNFIVAETSSPLTPLLSAVVASMGPQLYRCGNVTSPPYWAQRDYASMGPQLYRCGNGLLLIHLNLSLHASMGPQLYRCGNDLYVVRVVPRPGASMGPQLYRCGNVFLDPRRGYPGPRFNGAATLSLRKLRLAPITLLRHRHASMGPQLYRCGNFTVHILIMRIICASMGPQLYRCGNISVAFIYASNRDLLQWGRNFIVAETLYRTAHLEDQRMASMGPQLYRCGNEAIACMSGFCIRLLQWGRNFIVAETATPVDCVATSSSASMGPQLYRCGNYSGGTRPS